MSRLVYSCKIEKARGQSLDKDALLRRKFYEWRFGEYERVEKNEVLRELIYHPHNRLPLEVWKKAEMFLGLCETEETKSFFKRIIEKSRNKVIFG